MGIEQIEPAVVDAGPLIHLHEVGSLSLLGAFGLLYIPDAVWKETVDAGRVSEQQLRSLPNLRRTSVEQRSFQEFVVLPELRGLQNGELECLWLCVHQPCGFLLTDDLAVREQARSFGVTPVGSLGVVVRAARLGMLDLQEAEVCLRALYTSSSLFVTQAIVEMAIEQLKRYV